MKTSQSKKENFYHVFTMESKEQNYFVSMVIVENDTSFNAEDAQIIQKKLKESGDFEEVSIYACNNFKDETKRSAIIKRIAYQMQPIEFTRPFVLVNKINSIWNFYSDESCAIATRDDKNKPTENEYEKKDQPYKIITWSEYEATQKACWVSNPIEIDRERYWDMLEVLPPKNWHTTKEGLNMFFMSEFNSGTYTNSFIRTGTNEENYKYYEKGVDYCDTSTWCKRADIEALEA
ncbi:MAG: DUF1419 domain-containing protein [Desulfobacterales bacterium]|nr:DUF1419 domain-containing protein [Desulfobacterales bacterium]